MTGNHWIQHFLGGFSGQSLGDPNAHVDLSQAVGVAGAGTVHAASGEYRYPFGLYVLPGFLAGHGVQLGLTYRSFQVDNWRGSGSDPVAALEDPFGPGWRPSWGDLLVNLPQTAGGNVTRIDAMGTTWVYTLRTITYDPLSNPAYVYNGQAGSRLVFELQGSSYVWFRELPDRTRVEYETVNPGSGPVGRVKRIYRGAYAAPDWQITYNYTLSTSTAVSSIQDPRGVTVSYVYMNPPPAAGQPRVERMEISAPWIHPQNEAPKYTTYFGYSTSSPYQLTEIRQPARTVVVDTNRNGQYDLPGEQITAQVHTVFAQVGGSNRIGSVSDYTTGSGRLWQQITYDTTTNYTWRVAQQVTGESSSIPGQEPRQHTFFYGDSTIEWRQYLDSSNFVKRVSTTDLGQAWSPTARHVVRMDQTVSAVNPRPAGTNTFQTLTWLYAWDSCNCHSLTSLTTPRGIVYQWTYDAEGRALPTSASTTPVGGGAVLTRTWSYRTWDDADYRLASRLTGMVAADSVATTVTHTANSEGIQSQVLVTGVNDALFTAQEDLKGRLSWFEEMPFQVDSQAGGGTSRRRVRYIYEDNDANSADYRLLTQVHRFYDASNFHDVALTYEGLGYPKTFTDEKNRVTNLTCDVTGTVVQVVRPTTQSGKGTATYGSTTTTVPTLWGGVPGIVTQTAHDADGAAYTKATVSTHLVTDYFGRPWKVHADKGAMTDGGAPSWLTVTYGFDRLDRATSVTGPGRREAQFVVDDHGRLYQERQRLDTTTWATRSFEQDQDGALVKATDATGLVVDYTIDGYGRPGQATLPGSKTVVVGYDSEHRPLTTEYRVSGTLQRTTTRTRDVLGRVHVQTVNLPGTTVADTTTFDFTGLWRVAHVVDNNGRQSSTWFDTLGRVRRTSDHLTANASNESVFGYDETDRLRTIEDQPQKEATGGTYQQITYKTTFDLDAWDRIVQENRYGDTTGVLATRTWARDSLGRLTWMQDGVTKVTEFAYDALGRQLTKTLRPRTGASESPVVLTIAWDDLPTDTNLALQVTRQDGLSHPSVYLYDLADRLYERRLPGYSATTGVHRWRYQRDAEGRVTQWTDGNGTVVKQEFDAEKRLVRRWAGGHAVYLSAMATEESFGYDDFNRVQSARTWWNAFADPFTGQQGAAVLSLVDARSTRDGFGRLEREDFAYADNGFHVPLVTRSSVSGWTAGGSQDTRFRRSLTTGTGWHLDFAPDAAGKRSAADLTPPGGTSQAFATWRYLGSQAIARTEVPGATATQWVATTYGVDHLRYLTSIAATFGTGGTGATVYNLTVTRDVEGNVLDNRYAKANGRQGDWFQLDGFDRLKESKLGVTGFSNWGSVQYDTRTAYGLDSAQNRTQVDTQAWGQGVVSTQYTLETNSNRYLQVGTSGFTYDGNGNLISDGWYVYAYDYLDRLSEVYLITYPAGASGGSLSGTAVYGPEIQRARRGKRSNLTREAAATLVQRARARRARLASAGFTQGLGGAGLNQNLESGASNEEQVLVIVAWYGYDPMNRRVLKALPTQASWYGYDGWQKTDEYDALFNNLRVHLDGPGIDEHLGFANASGSGWTRYTLVQSNLGHVVAVVNGSGQVVERYEYEPDGVRRVFDGAGNALASTQIWLAAGFTGRDHDEESGLTYFRNRYYSAAIGRFVTVDPAGTWHDPMHWGNSYAHAANRATTLLDPLGLYTVGVVALRPTNTGDANLDRSNAEANAEDISAAQHQVARDPEGGAVVSISPNGEAGVVQGPLPNEPKDDSRAGIVFVPVWAGHGEAWDPDAGDYSGTVSEEWVDNLAVARAIRSYVPNGKKTRVDVLQCQGAFIPKDRFERKRNLAYAIAGTNPGVQVSAPVVNIQVGVDGGARNSLGTGTRFLLRPTASIVTWSRVCFHWWEAR